MLREFYQLYKQQRKRNHLLHKFRSRFPDVTVAHDIHIKGPLENLHVGTGTQIQEGVHLHLGGQDWCENAGYLSIGEHSTLSPRCIIYATGPGGVTIGDRFSAGPGVMIFSSTELPRNSSEEHTFKPVVIGNDVIIMSGSIISAGVRIGDNCYIGAGSVVVRDLPANCFAAGSPAEVKYKF